MTTDLVIREPLDIGKVFTQDGMNGLLQDIEAQVKAHVPDVQTDQGRKDIISLAYNVSRSKTLIVKTGEAAIEDEKKKVKRMTGLLKTAKDFLDNLRDETRQPVTDYENEQAAIKAEEERKEKEKIDQRVRQLADVNFVASFIEIATLTDEEFDTLLFDKTQDFKEEQARLAEERAAEERRLAEEAEARRLEDERLEAERKRQAEEAAKLAEERRKLEETQRIEREKLDAERKEIDREKEEIEAKKRAEVKEKERIEKEAREKEEKIKAQKEAEERAKRLAPDREKLISYFNAILQIPEPTLQREGELVLKWFSSKLVEIIERAKADLK